LGKLLSRAERNISWIENNILMPDGPNVGKPLRLAEFMKDDIRAIYDNPVNTRTAIISRGRKNAKTTESACLLLLHMVGPEHRRNSEVYSTAMSRDQAAIVFSIAAKMVRMSPTLSDLVSPKDSSKQLQCQELGTLYRALSADAATTYGLNPAFVIHDELGQVKGPMHPLYEAVETATAAQQDPISVVISTQAPTDGDLLSMLIDDGLQGHDPKTVIRLNTAPEDMNPFDADTIRLANPAFDEFMNQEEVLNMASKAERMPSREASFRNLVLNQRVEVFNPFVTKAVWEENAESAQVVNCFGGLDLSEVNDLTSLVLYDPETGGVDAKFWLPEDGIIERSQADRVPYDVWAKKGFITLTPGPSIEYEYVANYIAAMFRKKDIRKIAFDRWNMRHLKPWLVKAGLTEEFIDDRFVDFGQGYQSMSPALRNLESLLLNGKLAHDGNPVLRMCAMNSVIKMDEAGSRKLDKKKSRGRIDGMVALVMASAVASEDQHERPVYSVDLNSILEAV
jgi:phage terminase large subunit-like protein